MRAARDLVEGDLLQSEGRRPPGYPALIALAGYDYSRVWLLQIICGLASTAVLFLLALRLTGSPAVGFAAATLHTLNLQQLFFEASVMSESLSTLAFLVVTLVFLLLVDKLRENRRSALAIVLGLLSGVTVLIRPQFAFLPLVLPGLLLIYRRFEPKARGSTAAGAWVFGGGLAVVLAWCTWVYLNIGYFTLSTQSGSGFANHSAAFVEYAPERYATIRDVMLKHREEKLREQGHYANTFWLAMPELKQATGLSLPEISRQVQRMSIELFAAHPILYLKGVAIGWVSFWTVPNYWELDKIKPPAAQKAYELIWQVQHPMLRLANLAFVAFVALGVFSASWRMRTGWTFATTALATLVLAASVLQALVEFGTNSRYAVPVQSMTVLFVVVIVASWIGAVRRNPALARHPDASMNGKRQVN